MSNFVYQSWLADRGVHSPGSQPYDVLDANLDTRSCTLLVSSGSEQAKDLEKTQIQKLALALVGSEKIAVSWMLVAQNTSLIPLSTLRSLMPALTRVVWLDDSRVEDDGDIFKTEMTLLASRPLNSFYGPSLVTMNANPAVKSAFWNQLRSWNA